MSVTFDDNSDEVHAGMASAISRILEMWGIKIERYAKKLCPVGTEESTGIKGYRGGTLRNSITHEVNDQDQTVSAGSNIPYSAYVELGTGPYFTPPPEWERFDTPTPAGIARGYVHARPYLRPAILDHAEEYKRIAENELKG